MGIAADDVARVRDSTDIVAIISEHTEIKRSGRQWMARCPLHGERTPSLSVSPEKGVYYCFGCQRSGDAIKFVQEVEGIDFAAAVERLAARAGIQLRYTGRDERAAHSQRRKLLEAVAAARKFYHHRLLDTETSDAEAARSYLYERGYSDDLIRHWQLGWAPDGWNVLAQHLGLNDDDLRASGLGIVNRAGKQQDFFRGRILFPITDERGDTVGFGGRIMPNGDGPKYLNTSTEAKFYDKSKLLYGLHEHRRRIVKEGQAVICEGYTDVIGCAEAGIDTAVATCGTALTEDHMKLLKRFSAERIVLAFDSDAAGNAAASRVYAWERKFGVEVLAADLPAGEDPGSLSRSNPEALRLAITTAKPLLLFRVERLLAEADMSTIERQALTAKRAVELVGEHPDDVIRDRYIANIADRCRVDLPTLRRIATSRGRNGRRSSKPKIANQPEERLTPDDEALRLAIHNPEAAAWLDPAFLGSQLHREAYTALRNEGGVVAASERVSEEAAQLLRRLSVDDPGDTSIEDIQARVVGLTAGRYMNHLRHTVREENNIETSRQINQTLVRIQQHTHRLNDRSTRTEALQVLLPWLAEHYLKLEASASSIT